MFITFNHKLFFLKWKFLKNRDSITFVLVPNAIHNKKDKKEYLQTPSIAFRNNCLCLLN